MKGIYALYVGEKNILDGTVEELADYLKVTPKTIKFYASKVHEKRGKKNSDKRKIVVYIGKENKKGELYD